MMPPRLVGRATHMLVMGVEWPEPASTAPPRMRVEHAAPRVAAAQTITTTILDKSSFIIFNACEGKLVALFIQSAVSSVGTACSVLVAAAPVSVPNIFQAPLGGVRVVRSPIERKRGAPGRTLRTRNTNVIQLDLAAAVGVLTYQRLLTQRPRFCQEAIDVRYPRKKPSQ